MEKQGFVGKRKRDETQMIVASVLRILCREREGGGMDDFFDCETKYQWTGCTLSQGPLSRAPRPEQSDTVFHLEIIQSVLLIRQKSKRSKGGKNDRVAQDAKRCWGWCLLGIHRLELDARHLAISGWTGTGDDDLPQPCPDRKSRDYEYARDQLNGIRNRGAV